MESAKIVLEVDYKIIVGLIAVVAWLIRLEAKALYTEKDLNKFIVSASKKDDNVTKTLDNLQKTMTEIKTSLAKIEGRLEHPRREEN